MADVVFETQQPKKTAAPYWTSDAKLLQPRSQQCRQYMHHPTHQQIPTRNVSNRFLLNYSAVHISFWDRASYRIAV